MSTKLMQQPIFTDSYIAAIVHDLKNPLALIQGFNDLNIELIQEQIENKNCELDIIHNIAANSARISDHLKRCLSLAQAIRQSINTEQFIAANLNDLLEQYTKLTIQAFRQNNSSFTPLLIIELDNSLPLMYILPGQIIRAIINITENALEAMVNFPYSPGERPTFTLKTNRKDNIFQIEMTDNGPGMPDEVQVDACKAHFSTKKHLGNSGLGLSISQDIIVNEHKGSLNFQNISPHGLKVVINLQIHGSNHV